MAAETIQVDLSTAGSLSVLLRVKEGSQVCAFGNVPPAMKGTKWADEYHWRVFLWFGSRLFFCRHDLKTEQPGPWTFPELAAHHEKYPDHWSRL